MNIFFSKVFFSFSGILFFLASICYGFTIEIRLKNPSDIPISASVSLVRSYTDEYGNWWPHLGYLSKKGLFKQKPEIQDFIQPQEESNWIRLPAHGRILVCERISEKPVVWDVDVRVSQEKTISRSFSIPENRSVVYFYLYTVPFSPGPVKIEILTSDEVVERNIEIVRSVQQKHPGKTPEKIAIYTDLHLKTSDPVEYREKQYNFLRQAGINGLQYFSPELIPEIIKKGFLYLRWSGAGVAYNDYYKSKEEIESTIKSTALNISGIFERYNAIRYLRNLKLGDEISSGLLQDYVAKGEQTGIEVINYLKEKKIPLSDLNLSSYENIKMQPAPIMKTENPGLYYWVNRIRMERINNLFNIAKQANKRYMPYSWSSPNWPVSSYLGGGYEGQGWDLWHLYRNGNLDGIWGEDWPGYERWLRGGNAFLIDMMRCQVRGLPMGIYNVVESAHSPVYARYKFYEQLIRGVTEFFWYSYGCLRGNEANPWEIKTDIVQEIVLLNRDAGEAEQYLMNTQLEPAKIAILWTPAQEIWEPGYHNEILGIYYILLHSNYNIDFVSSYDVDAGEIKRYSVLYLPFNYIEKTTWEKIKRWVEDGGFLVIEGGFLKDECNREINIGEWIKGFSSKEVERIPSTGRLPLELPKQKLLDTTLPVPFPVVCSKYTLNVDGKDSVLLRYKDGNPAAVQIKKGKGTVRITGFYQGISYIYEQENKDRAKWGEVLLYHGFSPELRNFVVEPARISSIKKVCNIDKNLIVARKRNGEKLQCIALFDYGFGKDKPVMPVWSEIGETTVEIELGFVKKVRCLNGSIKEVKKGFYKVFFKGVAMLLIEK